MGQYHLVVNLDRKEYLHPHDCGDGLKLLEFGSSGDGTMLCLAILLATANGRGGGDLRIDTTDEQGELIQEYVVGRWAGERIAIIGDYFEDDDVPGFTDVQVGVDDDGKPLMGDVPWMQSNERDLGWTNVSTVAIQAIELDSYIKQDRHKPVTRTDENGVEQKIVVGKNKDGSPIYYTRASSFGGPPKPTARLLPDGTIERIEVES